MRIHRWFLDGPLWRIAQNCADPRALLFAVVGSALYVAGAGAMLIPYERDPPIDPILPFDDACFLRSTLLLAIPAFDAAPGYSEPRSRWRKGDSRGECSFRRVDPSWVARLPRGVPSQLRAAAPMTRPPSSLRRVACAAVLLQTAERPRTATQHTPCNLSRVSWAMRRTAERPTHASSMGCLRTATCGSPSARSVNRFAPFNSRAHGLHCT